ncbi:MAG: response regulator [Candidatus Sumerlaeia bacterium]|nr:response regulator [Candidatus Sumerlaeia bacterium]
MAGERVLVVDHSATVQEISKAILEEHGFRVTVASNGLAAITHPEVEDYDLIVVDSSLEGIDGLETTRQIKTDKEIYKIPVLLLIPEDSIDLFESVPLKGATGWLSKPFSPKKLLAKVTEVLDEQRILQLSEEFLKDSAERHMQALAEQKIQTAVEKKIQIIVERAIQSIVSIIDQRAKREVEARVTSLSAEKEQELVKMTVQEVAKSMVEKLAEKKVSEAIANILVDQTEKTVKRAADGMLPSMIRERLKEQIETTLPREIENRVTKAAEERAAEIGESIVEIIQTHAQKLVPVIARDTLPELAERQVLLVSETKLPMMIQNSAREAMNQQMNNTVQPYIMSEVKKLRKMVLSFLIGIIILILVAGIIVFFAAVFGGNLANSMIQQDQSAQVVTQLDDEVL